MLLSLMRRHAKSWLIKFLIAIIALVFIFYFGYSFTSKEGVKVAEVNGEVISGMEYQRTYRELLTNLKREYGTVWNDNLIKVFDLKNRALEELIDKKIISQEARRIGMDITEKEIQDRILSYPAFQFRGQFDENRYRSLLANNRMKPENFETIIAQDMLRQKLSQFLLTFLLASDREILEQYTYMNQQVKIGFVHFAPEDFKESIQIDPDPMKNYFEEHKEAYRIPEKIKLSYITIDPDDFREKIRLDDLEIVSYYEDNMEMFTEERQVKARHILFKVDPDAPEDEEKKVKERALEVLEKAHSGSDFSELAKQYSEGPTREDGGDLGYFSRGRMVKPFEDAAFAMEKGQISDLVRTSFGYHIIKVEDIREEKTKPLEEVREQISDILTRTQSMDLANEKALSLIDQMPYDVDLDEYAAQHQVPASTTAYFSRDDPVPELAGDGRLLESIFALQEKDVSDVIEFKEKFYIFQVSSKKPSYLPEMEEVSEELREDYGLYLAKKEAESAAEKYLAELKGGRDWSALAEEWNMETDTTDFFTRLDFPPKIGMTPGLQEVAFKLSRENRYPDTIFENEKGAYVIRWEAEKGIDKEKFKEEKERYAASLMMTKQQYIFRSWLDRLKMRADIDRSPFEEFK